MARYATIDWDVNGSPSESQWTVDADSVAWTEYEGASPSLDGVLDVTTNPNSDYGLTPTRRYLGSGQFQDLDLNRAVTETRYAHGDLVDSTQLQTDDLGAPAESPVGYTAFGEPIGDPTLLGTRFQYLAGWAHESDLLALITVNPTIARIELVRMEEAWWSPDAGRLLQPANRSGGLSTNPYEMDLTRFAPVDGSRWVSTSYPGREWWEDVRQATKKIDKYIRLVRNPTGKIDKATAAARLKGAASLRNALYRIRFGPLIVAMCVEIAVDELVKRGDEWARRTRGVEGDINRRRVCAQGGFSESDCETLWGN